MTRPDFTKRSFAAEWLDVNGHSDALPAYLRDLAWLNRAALGPWTMTRWLARAVAQTGAREPFTLLDVGCGDGDVLRAIRRWATRNDLAFDLTGIDIDPHTIAIARTRTDARAYIEFHAADVFDFTPAQPPDFMVSSLLAHHLSDEQIVSLVGLLEQNARLGWLIYDLQRSAFVYHAIGAIGKIATLHPMVAHDGRTSVRRSLTGPEWRSCLRDAGLDCRHVRIDWFLFRLLVSRLRAGS